MGRQGGGSEVRRDGNERDEFGENGEGDAADLFEPWFHLEGLLQYLRCLT